MLRSRPARRRRDSDLPAASRSIHASPAASSPPRTSRTSSTTHVQASARSVLPFRREYEDEPARAVAHALRPRAPPRRAARVRRRRAERLSSFRRLVEQRRGRRRAHGRRRALRRGLVGGRRIGGRLVGRCATAAEARTSVVSATPATSSSPATRGARCRGPSSPAVPPARPPRESALRSTTSSSPTSRLGSTRRQRIRRETAASRQESTTGRSGRNLSAAARVGNFPIVLVAVALSAHLLRWRARQRGHRRRRDPDPPQGDFFFVSAYLPLLFHVSSHAFLGFGPYFSHDVARTVKDGPESPETLATTRGRKRDRGRVVLKRA